MVLRGRCIKDIDFSETVSYEGNHDFALRKKLKSLGPEFFVDYADTCIGEIGEIDDSNLHGHNYCCSSHWYMLQLV